MKSDKFKLVCFWGAMACMIIAGSIAFEIWQRDKTFGGSISTEQARRLVGSIAGWSIFSVLPLIPAALAWVKKFIPGAGGNTSELGSLVNAVESLLNMFGGGKFSATYLIELFRTMGLPVWFYIGISWGEDKTYAGGFGQVPTPLPPPPNPPNPTAVVKTFSPTPPAPAAAATVMTAGTANP